MDVEARNLALLRSLKVALVHDWLTGMRGGEKVLECLAEIFPQAHLFTLLKTARLSPRLEALPVTCSPAQRLPLLKRYYRHYLPLYPWAISRLDLSGFDLVVSSSHCVAKAAKARPAALHLAYIHTPMRYVWDLYPVYFGPPRHILIRALMRPTAAWLRRWDKKTSRRPDRLVCNSSHVAERIKRHWGRSAEVIPPPVETSRFHWAKPQDYYLIVSALAPYKGIELAIEAAKRRRFRLVIAGDGPERQRLEGLAGPTVEFLGRVADDEVVQLFANCRAFLFPGEEDFGITPVEAMAAGKPVIALGRGGVWDSVVPFNPPAGQTAKINQSPTGVFFYQPSAEALLEAIDLFEADPGRFQPEVLQARARRFDRSVFLARFIRLAAQAWAEHSARLPAF